MSWFEDEEIWKIRIAREAYDLTGHEVFTRDWILRDRFRECALPFLRSIAEGLDGSGRQDALPLLKLAECSCVEFREHLKMVHSRKLIEWRAYLQLSVRTTRLLRQLASLTASLQKASVESAPGPVSRDEPPVSCQDLFGAARERSPGG